MADLTLGTMDSETINTVKSLKTQMMAVLGLAVCLVVVNILTMGLVLSSSGETAAQTDLKDGQDDIKKDIAKIPTSAPRTKKPVLLMATDVDYPPYTFLRSNPVGVEQYENIEGVSVDMIRGLAEHCGTFDVEIIRGSWIDCWNWNGPSIGIGLLESNYEGCLAYTHTNGIRNQYMDFAPSFTRNNQPAGILVRLDANGNPEVSGTDNFAGKTIVDVGGWAPTADTLNFVANSCNGEALQPANVVDHNTLMPSLTFTVDGTTYTPGGGGVNENDVALLALLEGQADGLYIYANQPVNYACADGETNDAWNCDLWRLFGTKFAFIHTGMYDWTRNGTTFAMAKPGGEAMGMIRDCADSFIASKAYADICTKDYAEGTWSLNQCIQNSHLAANPDYTADPTLSIANSYYFRPTEYTTQQCSDGYCKCDAGR